jgi:DNA modification methylase
MPHTTGRTRSTRRPSRRTRSTDCPSSLRCSAATGVRSPAPALDLQVERVPLDSLTPWPSNPRTISPAQFAALSRSVAEFGMVDPILVRKADRVVIGGHQRLDVAKALGLSAVPVIFLDLSEHQASLLNIALNKIAGEWDWEQLGQLLTQLRDLPEVDVSLSGFDTEELEELLAELEAQHAGPEEPDFAAADALVEVKSTGRVQPGQLWALGRHRLLCADSLAPDSLSRLCQGVAVPLVVTDPPYGIGYQSRLTSSRSRKARIANDEAAGFEPFLERALAAVRAIMAQGATMYWFAGGGGPTPALGQALLAVSRYFDLQNCLVWDKETPGLGWRWRRSWEAIIEASVGAPSQWYGGSHRRNVLRWPKLIPQEGDHPTPKPTELLAELLRGSSRAGQVVLDPFAGSGSTLLAAELTGRTCHAIELEPGYCELILARWEQVTGQPARVAEEG